MLQFLFWRVCHANLDHVAPWKDTRFFFSDLLSFCLFLPVPAQIHAIGLPLNYQTAGFCRNSEIQSSLPFVHQFVTTSLLNLMLASLESLYTAIFFKAFRKQVKGKAVISIL